MGLFPGIISRMEYVSMIKPRMSYGENGNLKDLGDFQVFGGYGLSGIYNNEKGYSIGAIPLLDLKWES